MLEVWTIYDHPRDFPTLYVARKFICESGRVRPTEDMMADPSIDRLREALAGMGLVALSRAGADDPLIVETWL